MAPSCQAGFALRKTLDGTCDDETFNGVATTEGHSTSVQYQGSTPVAMETTAAAPMQTTNGMPIRDYRR